METVEGVQRSLGRIEGKLDALTITVTEHIKVEESKMSYLEDRLDKLQETVTVIKTQSAVLSGIVAFVTSLVSIFWKKL